MKYTYTLLNCKQEVQLRCSSRTPCVLRSSQLPTRFYGDNVDSYKGCKTHDRRMGASSVDGRSGFDKILKYNIKLGMRRSRLNEQFFLPYRRNNYNNKYFRKILMLCRPQIRYQVDIYIYIYIN